LRISVLRAYELRKVIGKRVGNWFLYHSGFTNVLPIDFQVLLTVSPSPLGIWGLPRLWERLGEVHPGAFYTRISNRNTWIPSSSALVGSFLFLYKNEAILSLGSPVKTRHC
jgi:hypothetical protein